MGMLQDGRSALMYAVGGCYKANVERLLWAGADFSLQDKVSLQSEDVALNCV
jgi:hypothetical protein